MFERQRRRVDAHAAGAAVEPEADDVLVLGPYGGVVPVEVGLGRREQVQVPVAGRPVGVLGAGPRRVAEVGAPAVRRLAAVGALARPEPEAVAQRRVGTPVQRLDEPQVAVRHVVGDDVDDRADPERQGLGDEPLGLGERAEQRVDVAVVGDVVAAVGERRHVPRGEPDGVDPEVAQVAEPRAHAGEIADAVAVGVGEAARIDLVDEGVAPPLALVAASLRAVTLSSPSVVALGRRAGGRCQPRRRRVKQIERDAARSRATYG